LLLQRRDFIEETVNIARKHGALVIFDEVISGFRVAMGGMTEILGIRPRSGDLRKSIGGGFPVGAYGGRRDLMKMVAPSGPVYQAGTLRREPLSVCALAWQLCKRSSAFKAFESARRTH
jgi:glutamate-1-semialdehyde 2,1-aminomutase